MSDAGHGSDPANGQARHAPRFFRVAVVTLTLLTIYGAWTARPRADNVWDFGAFHYAGAALQEGENPYTDEWRPEYESLHGILFTTVNLNPPTSLPWFWPLGSISPRTGFTVLWFVNLVLFIGIVGLLAKDAPHPRGLRFMWALALTGFWQTLGMGQLYVLLLGLLLLAYRNLESRPWAAGLALGLICSFKPQFALAAGLLLLAGSWQVAVTAGLTVLASWGLGVGLFGTEMIGEWVEAVRAYPHAVASSNASLSTFLGRLIPAPAVLFLSGAAIAAAAWATLRSGAATRTLDLGILLSLAISPVSWVGYSILALPMLLRSHWEKPVFAAALVLLVPANLIWLFDTAYGFRGLTWLYPAALAVLVVHAFARVKQPSS